jgi:hypothetical protein
LQEQLLSAEAKRPFAGHAVRSVADDPDNRVMVGRFIGGF